MQRVLEKMAKQLNAYDEASLMQLWHHYALQVSEFEPTKRWEEAAIALCLIQAVRWKNQLFNYNLALTAAPEEGVEPPVIHNFFMQKKEAEALEEVSEKHKATVLRFPSKRTE